MVWKDEERIWKSPESQKRESDCLWSDGGEQTEHAQREQGKEISVPIWKETAFQEADAVPETSDDYRYEEAFEQVLSAYGQFENL